MLGRVRRDQLFPNRCLGRAQDFQQESGAYCAHYFASHGVPFVRLRRSEESSMTAVPSVHHKCMSSREEATARVRLPLHPDPNTLKMEEVDQVVAQTSAAAVVALPSLRSDRVAGFQTYVQPATAQQHDAVDPDVSAAVRSSAFRPTLQPSHPIVDNQRTRDLIHMLSSITPPVRQLALQFPSEPDLPTGPALSPEPPRSRPPGWCHILFPLSSFSEIERFLWYGLQMNPSLVVMPCLGSAKISCESTLTTLILLCQRKDTLAVCSTSSRGSPRTEVQLRPTSTSAFESSSLSAALAGASSFGASSSPCRAAGSTLKSEHPVQSVMVQPTLPPYGASPWQPSPPPHPHPHPQGPWAGFFPYFPLAPMYDERMWLPMSMHVPQVASPHSMYPQALQHYGYPILPRTLHQSLAYHNGHPAPQQPPPFAGTILPQPPCFSTRQHPSPLLGGGGSSSDSASPRPATGGTQQPSPPTRPRGAACHRAYE
jgi:hypothetical protein